MKATVMHVLKWSIITVEIYEFSFTFSNDMCFLYFVKGNIEHDLRICSI